MMCRAARIAAAALKNCHQFLYCDVRELRCHHDRYREKRRIHLNRSYHGLYLAPMIWREMDNFSSGSVCLALASSVYDPADYYRVYEGIPAPRSIVCSQIVNVPFNDFVSPYKELRAELDEAYSRFPPPPPPPYTHFLRCMVLGKEVEAFEQEYAAYCGTQHCVGVANGLDAMHLVLRAWDIGPGDEVIVPSNTYIATWLAISHAGAMPVPVEPDCQTL